MTQPAVFLMGGGWDEAAYRHTYGRFAAAAGGASARIACVMIDGDDREMHYAWAASAFAKVGVPDMFPVYVSSTAPLHEAHLRGATGIFVGGGPTPAYHDAIVASAKPWLPAMVERGVPFAGISAGAMIAAELAIVGGWKLRYGQHDIVICSEELSEERELLDVRPSLGLVPFAIDAHASQFGSPTRLMHAINAGVVPAGWAIDEDTMLAVIEGEVRVHGLGGAYHVRADGTSLRVEIIRDDSA